ncbi:hypothetical protein FQZ97_943690 [compost metagenome]
MESRNFLRISSVSSPMKVVRSGVSPATGFNATTRIYAGASSIASAFVTDTTQPLVALYQARFGRGRPAPVEATFRMTPSPFFFICGMSLRVIR